MSTLKIQVLSGFIIAFKEFGVNIADFQGPLVSMKKYPKKEQTVTNP